MRIATTGLVVGALILILFLSWTSDGPPSDVAKGRLSEEKPIILKNPELSDFDNNRLTMRIRAETARVFENKKITLLQGIDGDIFSNEKQQSPTRVIADAGRIMGNSKLITLWGNVRVFFADGQKLYTERMNLDQKKERLYNKVAVRVVSENDKILADRMRYNIKTGVLILHRPKAWIDTEADQLQ